MDADPAMAPEQRRTIAQAGERYVEYLETIMERKRTTIADYRGHLRRISSRSSPSAPSTRSMEFPRFDGHLTAGPSGLAWRMSVDAQDVAVFAAVSS
jgi:hypothetical protein